MSVHAEDGISDVYMEKFPQQASSNIVLSFTPPLNVTRSELKLEPSSIVRALNRQPLPNVRFQLANHGVNTEESVPYPVLRSSCRLNPTSTQLSSSTRPYTAGREAEKNSCNKHTNYAKHLSACTIKDGQEINWTP
jgi:hypothetical protein